MKLRTVIALATLSSTLPAAAGEVLRPEQAQQFVAGKYFSYTCFEGTSGAGRIQADGSVVGTIRMRGQGQTRFVSLPAGTIRVKSNAICATLRGLSMEPCFNVEKIDANSFRGSVSGLGFAYCQFARRNPRLQLANSDELSTSSFTSSIRRARGVKSADAATIEAAPLEAPTQLAPANGEFKLRPSGEELKLRPTTSE